MTPPLPLPEQPASMLTKAFAFARRADAKTLALVALAISALCFFGVDASDFGSVDGVKAAALRIIAAADAPMVAGTSGQPSR